MCAAGLVTFANNLSIKAGVGHTNFLLLYYVPCIAAIALWGIEDFPRIVPRTIAGVAVAAALLALLFSTDVYTAWMFTLTLLIAAGAVMALRSRSVAAVMRQHWRPLTVILAVGAIAFGVAFIPFVLIYVPVRSIAPLRSYQEYLFFAPLPGDIVNVSSWNLLWGWLAGLMRLRQGSETMLAVTPGMTALFLVFAFVLRKGVLGSGPWQIVFIACGVAVWAMGWLLTLRIGTVSGFWLVRYLVPGATGIRAGMRLQLIANLWIALGLAVSLEYWLRTASTGQLGRPKRDSRRRSAVLPDRASEFDEQQPLAAHPRTRLSGGSANTTGGMPCFFHRCAAATRLSRSNRCDVDFAASRAADLEWPGGLVSSGMGLHRRCRQFRCCPALDHSHRLTRASLHV